MEAVRQNNQRCSTPARTVVDPQQQQQQQHSRTPVRRNSVKSESPPTKFADKEDEGRISAADKRVNESDKKSASGDWRSPVGNECTPSATTSNQQQQQQQHLTYADRARPSRYSKTCVQRPPKFVVVVDRWSLFRGNFFYKNWKWDPKLAVVVDKLS